MIRCNKGEVEFSGVKPDVKAEFSCIVHHLLNHFDKDELTEAFEHGLMTDEQISEAVKECRQDTEEILNEIEKLLRDIKERVDV